MDYGVKELYVSVKLIELPDSLNSYENKALSVLMSRFRNRPGALTFWSTNLSVRSGTMSNSAMPKLLFPLPFGPYMPTFIRMPSSTHSVLNA